MIRSQLRLYCGPDRGITAVDTTHRENQVTVSAGEIFSALSDAVQNDKTWLRDFEDDEVTISTDLYEVILAYQHYHRPTAG